jgi:hypothetical protein
MSPSIHLPTFPWNHMVKSAAFLPELMHGPSELMLILVSIASLLPPGWDTSPLQATSQVILCHLLVVHFCINSPIWATGREIRVVPALCCQMVPLSCPHDREISSCAAPLYPFTSQGHLLKNILVIYDTSSIREPPKVSYMC